MDKRYNLVDAFIIAHNVRQVHYVSYPVIRRDKHGWCVAIKMKLRGCIESNNLEDDLPYQVEEMSHINKFIELQSISWLQDLGGGVEEVNPANLLPNEGESNNFEEDNEVELEDEFKVYNSKED